MVDQERRDGEREQRRLPATAAPPAVVHPSAAPVGGARHDMTAFALLSFASALLLLSAFGDSSVEEEKYGVKYASDCEGEPLTDCLSRERELTHCP